MQVGRRATDAEPPEQVGLSGPAYSSAESRNTSLIATPLPSSSARAADIGDDQVQALGRAGRRGGGVFAEDDRTAGAGRRELNDASRAGPTPKEPPPCRS